MVDRALILRKLAEIEEYLAQIREFKDISVDQYCKDWKVQRIVERTLQMMIEACVDIAAHIISDRGYRIPKTYADTFKVLYEREILTEDLFKVMEKMAKFRNIIVHHYNTIEPEIVIGILKKNLEDLLLFKDAILKSLEKENTEQT
jgi:uncharacterized protein YutE (UPF0331/DUF86 family)